MATREREREHTGFVSFVEEDGFGRVPISKEIFRVKISEKEN